MRLTNGYRLQNFGSLMGDVKRALAHAVNLNDVKLIALFYGLGSGYVGCLYLQMHGHLAPRFVDLSKREAAIVGRAL